MLLFPKNSKFKKLQKGSLANKIRNVLTIKNLKTNSIKLIATEYGNVKSNQLQAFRALVKKLVKKKGFFKIYIFPHFCVTKKPLSIRMGKGKGNISHWITKISYGSVICEVFVKKVLRNKIIKMIKKAQMRLPIKTRIIP